MARRSAIVVRDKVPGIRHPETFGPNYFQFLCLPFDEATPLTSRDIIVKTMQFLLLDIVIECPFSSLFTFALEH